MQSAITLWKREVISRKDGVAVAMVSRLSSQHLEAPVISWGSEDMQDDGSLQGVRVLVVEDTWQVAVALKSTLTDAGTVVLGPVGTAADAERLVAKEAPDLVLVDLNLHGEMAFDLVDRLRQRGVCVIVMSGLAVLPRSVHGDTAFLKKPFGTDELLMAMRQTMPAKREG
jgi:DNA-binding NtrC family response regulator